MSWYRKEVLRTFELGQNFREKLNLGALGLAGETGEVVDLLKKHLFHGKELDRDKLKLELGDVRWYLEVLAHSAGFSMDEIEEANIEKLRKRFPGTGFTTEDANSKKDENPCGAV